MKKNKKLQKQIGEGIVEYQKWNHMANNDIIQIKGIKNHSVNGIQLRTNYGDIKIAEYNDYKSAQQVLKLCEKTGKLLRLCSNNGNQSKREWIENVQKEELETIYAKYFSNAVNKEEIMRRANDKIEYINAKEDERKIFNNEIDEDINNAREELKSLLNQL